jgi:F-type H+-transporting ATPase subunit b
MRKIAASVILMLLVGGALIAQEGSAAREPHAGGRGNVESGPEKSARQSGAEKQLVEASREAAGEGEENTEFKYSPSVRWLAGLLHVDPRAAYWISNLVNFGVIAAAIILVWRTNIPGMFRSRTQSIQKAMLEARRASEDAARRLSEVESRLARLDAEIVAMQQQAEREAAAGEEKIRSAATADAHRVVESAEQEIAATAKAARRELTAFAAELAVSLAQKRIQVDPQTDKQLVRSFAEELGGRGFKPPPSGKDGR